MHRVRIGASRKRFEHQRKNRERKRTRKPRRKPNLLFWCSIKIGFNCMKRHGLDTNDNLLQDVLNVREEIAIGNERENVKKKNKNSLQEPPQQLHSILVVVLLLHTSSRPPPTGLRSDRSSRIASAAEGPRRSVKERRRGGRGEKRKRPRRTHAL
jgi:hypothetical protein